MSPRRDRLALVGLVTVTCLAVPVVLAGTGVAAVEDLTPATTRADVTFTDADVPPQYHRSWQLLLEPAGPLATVTDEEEVVDTNLAEMPAEEWAGLVDALPALLDEMAGAAAAQDGEGCTGGTTLRLEVFEHVEQEGGSFDNDLSEEAEVTSCTEDGDAAIRRVLGALTPVAEPTGLPEQARSWPR